MESRSEDKLKVVLRNLELQSPSKEFTSEVMMGIQSVAINDYINEGKLKDLLMNHALVSVPSDLTYQIMNQVSKWKSSPAEYPSIISKRAWYAIGSFVTLLLVIAFIDGRGDFPVGEPLYFISVGKYLNLIFSRYLDSILFSAGACCAAVFLLAVEYWLRKKISNHITMI